MNGGPAAYESAALPTELHRHVPQTGGGLYHGRTAGDKPFCLLGSDLIVGGTADDTDVGILKKSLLIEDAPITFR